MNNTTNKFLYNLSLLLIWFAAYLTSYLLLFILAFGIILYLSGYLADRALWVDEAMVSLDIIRLPMNGFLHQPLPYLQVAPLGLLLTYHGLGYQYLPVYPATL